MVLCRIYKDSVHNFNIHNTCNNLNITAVISRFVLDKIFIPMKPTVTGFKIKKDLILKLKVINILNMLPLTLYLILGTKSKMFLAIISPSLGKP